MEICSSASRILLKVRLKCVRMWLKDALPSLIIFAQVAVDSRRVQDAHPRAGCKYFLTAQVQVGSVKVDITEVNFGLIKPQQ